MARTRCYQRGVLVDEGFSLTELGEQLSRADGLVWVDLCKPTSDELATVGAELGLHALAGGMVVSAMRPVKAPIHPSG